MVTFEQIYKNNEVIIGILRAGKSHFKYGDDFEFSCVVVIRDKKALLCGAISRHKFSIVGIRKDFKKILKQLGVTKVEWKRYKTRKYYTKYKNI